MVNGDGAITQRDRAIADRDVKLVEQDAKIAALTISNEDLAWSTGRPGCSPDPKEVPTRAIRTTT